MFKVGDRVRVINPKSIAHLEAGNMRTTGTIVKIEGVEKMVKVEWNKPREDRSFLGYFVTLDDNPLNTIGTPYQASELEAI